MKQGFRKERENCELFDGEVPTHPRALAVLR